MVESKRIGKYEILEEIGSGGFAIVYKAHDPALDRVVALKVLHLIHASQADLVKRFIFEARRAARLRHTNVVHIYEVGEDKGLPFIAMEYLPGGSLAQRLGDALFPVEMVISIVQQVALALDYAHKKRLIHRDVKPANILFDEENHAVLGDFGLVKSLADSGLTVDGTRLGTPSYMAPEQVNANAEIGPAADIYALGIVGYKLLTGQVPFQSDSMIGILHAHVYDSPRDPRELNPALDGAVSHVLLKVLAKDPVDRYESASMFAKALSVAWESGQGAASTKAVLADLYSRAQEAIHVGNWGAVVTLCVEMRNLDPDYRDVGALLTLAASWLAEEEQKRQLWRDLNDQYTMAVSLLQSGAYADAVDAFEILMKKSPDYPGLREKLDEARQALENACLYQSASERLSSEVYDAACADLLTILELDPEHVQAKDRLPEAATGVLEQLLVTRGDLVHAKNEIHVLQGGMAELEQQLEQNRLMMQSEIDSIWAYDHLLLALETQDHEQAAKLAKELAIETRSGALTVWTRIKRGLPAGDRWVRPKDDKEMVRIPFGKFLYGVEKLELELAEFWIDRAPVTNAEYARFVAATKHSAPAFWGAAQPAAEILLHPVTQISWDDAMTYAKWVGGRLPTEQEWEKAARGPDGRAYPWGNEFDAALCNTEESDFGSVTPVGQYSPAGDSFYGVADMAGNVWEWTASAYVAGKPHRVFRGGAFCNNAEFARCVARDRDYPLNFNELIGFRVVISGV